jgi:hypothetical protein
MDVRNTTNAALAYHETPCSLFILTNDTANTSTACYTTNPKIAANSLQFVGNGAKLTKYHQFLTPKDQSARPSQEIA